jgi:hypothetical protein
VFLQKQRCDLTHHLAVWQAYGLFWARCGTAVKPRNRFVNPIGKGGRTAARDRCLPESEMAIIRTCGFKKASATWVLRSNGGFRLIFRVPEYSECWWRPCSSVWFHRDALGILKRGEKC